ncbi:MAG TPA: hypothetical protein VIO43_01285 [Lutibacter sp.]
MSFFKDLVIHTDIAFFTLPNGNLAHVEFALKQDMEGFSRDYIIESCIKSAAYGSEVRIISTKDYTNNGEREKYKRKYPNNTFTILDNKIINNKDYFPLFWDKFDRAYDISEQKQIILDFISKYR